MMPHSPLPTTQAEPKSSSYKVKTVGTTPLPVWKKYAAIVVGKTQLWPLIRFELITLLFGSLPGALGLVCRKLFYPTLFASVGKGAAFGRNICLRHPHKISIGNNVIIDDNCVLDAKGGEHNQLQLGNGVFIGRNTIIYTKNGNLQLMDNVNIGPNSQLYSNNKLLIGKGTMVAAYSYIMSGGRYDYQSEQPFCQQSSFSCGPTTIGGNSWIGAKVIIQDGCQIGNNVVIGSGSVVTKDIPDNAVAFGVPAQVQQQTHYTNQDK